jgi:hypothetical protein
MRIHLKVMSLFMLLLFQPSSPVKSDVYTFRLYYGSNCPYSKLILLNWHDFATHHPSSMWDCELMVCRYPTPTLFVFKGNSIDDIHLGSHAILSVINPSP